MLRTTLRCECADPNCPAHSGVGRCAEPAVTCLFREDQQDADGTLFCAACAEDATESGLYYTIDPLDRFVLTMLRGAAS